MDALEAAIVDSPNDAARYAVFADALIQKGKVRGELIALQLKLSTVKDTGAFARLKAREPELLAQVSRDALGPLPDGIEVHWKWGFVRRVVCATADAGALRDVLKRPALRAVQAVGLYPCDDARVRVLLEVKPRAMNRLELYLGQLGDDAAFALTVGFPALERLFMRGDEFSPRVMDFPALRALDLGAMAPGEAFEQRLGRAAWKTLRKLTLDVPELPTTRVERLLASGALTHVRLNVADFGLALRVLGERDDLAQLAVLHLAGAVTDAQLAPLLTRLNELEGLKLTLPARGLSIETAVLLRRSLKVQLLGIARAEEDPGVLRMTADEAIAYREQQDQAAAVARAERDYD